MSTSFRDIQPQLSTSVLETLDSFGFEYPTPVQQTTIPLFLSNKDVCVQATTGSGKTLAFTIPIFEIIHKIDVLKKGSIYAMIIAPTRELATQIFTIIQQFSQYSPHIQSMLLIGGTGIHENINVIERFNQQIIVGTPGRILDIINRKIFNLKALEIFIMDEADTLLDLGFKDTINQILSSLPKQRRTGLFSATQTSEVKELARAGLRNPVSICVKVQAAISANSDVNDDNGVATSSNSSRQLIVPSTLDNFYEVIEYEHRITAIVQFIRAHPASKVIVFCSTCSCVDYYSTVFDKLLSDPSILPNTESSILPITHTTVLGLHGKMITKKRTALFRKFTQLSAGVLFCTDVTARGIDIPNIDWIIQLTAPKDPAFFIHRIGRTARAGHAGSAILFLAENELSYINLLAGRNVTLVQREEDLSSNLHTLVLQRLKDYAMSEREVLEGASTAFMAFLKAYQEHLCSFIFRIDELDIGSVAKAYGLLRLPKIPETRRKTGVPIVFTNTDVDTSSIPYRHVEKEKARLNKLKKMKEETAREKAVEEEELARGDTASVRARAKVAWDENYEQKSDPKRKRKKKQSKHQAIMEEWDELAAEETMFKKFKKGKLSKDDYEEMLFSEDVAVEKSSVGRHETEGDDDGGDGDDGDGECSAMNVRASRISCGGSADKRTGKKPVAAGDFRRRSAGGGKRRGK